MLQAKQSQAWLELNETLPENMQAHGRLRFITAQAALAENKLALVKQFFDDKVVIADLREGASQLTDLWYNYHAQQISKAEAIAITDELKKRVEQEHPIPKHFDFRMLES